MTPRAAALALCAAALTARAPAQTASVASRARGRIDAPLTLYEMSDFQCPFCRQFEDSTMPAIDRAYIATGKLRLVYVNFPLRSLHPNAEAAAELAMCAARQGKFWPVHDALFRRQREWAGLPDPGGFFATLADSAGVNRDTLAACLLGAGRIDVAADSAIAQQAGARGTPTFVVEGLMFSGAQRFPVFQHLLDSLYQAKAAH